MCFIHSFAYYVTDNFSFCLWTHKSCNLIPYFLFLNTFLKSFLNLESKWFDSVLLLLNLILNSNTHLYYHFDFIRSCNLKKDYKVKCIINVNKNIEVHSKLNSKINNWKCVVICSYWCYRYLKKYFRIISTRMEKDIFFLS